MTSVCLTPIYKQANCSRVHLKDYNKQRFSFEQTTIIEVRTDWRSSAIVLASNLYTQLCRLNYANNRHIKRLFRNTTNLDHCTALNYCYLYSTPAGPGKSSVHRTYRLVKITRKVYFRRKVSKWSRQ